MTTKILTSSVEILGAARSVLAQGPVRVAVAFWGTGAAHQLGLDRRDLSAVCILCNLSVGGCTPGAIEDLMRRGAQVRALATLHAKVFLGQDTAVVGSANASINALRAEGGFGWNEACVQVASPSDLAHLHAWFEALWESAVDMSDPHVARLLLEQAEHDVKTPGFGTDAIDLLRQLRESPDALDDEPLYLTLDWVGYSRRVGKQVKQLRQSTGLHIDAWENWKEMPPAAELLSFHYDVGTREVSYENAWRTPRDPRSEMDSETRAIFVFAAPRILQTYELGDRNAWISAVGRFQRDLFATPQPSDKDAILHISTFAKRYLKDGCGHRKGQANVSPGS